MSKLMSKRAFFIGLLILTVASFGWAADFDAGLEAYHEGDYEAALQAFKPLAERGDAIAQYRLGLMYKNGEGVPQDDVEAVRWFRKAAEQGHAGAQSYLITIIANNSPAAAGESEPKSVPPRSDVHRIPLAIPPLPEQQSTDNPIPLAIPPLPEQQSAEILVEKPLEEPAAQVEPAKDSLPLETTPERLTPSAPVADISPPSIPEPEENISAGETPPAPASAQSTDIAKASPPSEVKATESAPPESETATTATKATTAMMTAPTPQIQAQPSAKPAPKAESKRKARPRSGSFRVQLASIRARSRAENLWRELQRKHRSLLSGLSLNVQRAELEQGIFHRLQAGPLSRAEAESICAALKRQNQGCLVVNR